MEFPKEFEHRVKNDPFLGEELLLALNQDAPTSIRLNAKKGPYLFNNEEAIPWSKNGKWLKERPIFTLDPLFHGGAYYPQEAGSQFLSFILDQIELPKHAVALDLCAAPGGKSTLILDYLQEDAVLISNEIIPNRAKILKENLTKWGASNNIVTSNAPKDFQSLPETFDLVVIDAPCSGEGMFRKDPEARKEWSESNVEMCANRQQDILIDIWDAVKPGGYIVYSTCTFNRNENEANVQWIIDEFDATYIPVNVPFAQAGRDNLGWYALPGKLATEGFYIAVLRKGESTNQHHKAKKFKAEVIPVSGDQKIDLYLNLNDQTLVQWNKFLFAIPSYHLAFFQQVQALMHVIKLGTELGETTPKGLIPNPALAFDQAIISSHIQHFDLTKEQALKYLKGDTFPLEGHKGFAIMRYEGVNLGWINHLGNRFNNLYPKEWRIRMRID